MLKGLKNTRTNKQKKETRKARYQMSTYETTDARTKNCNRGIALERSVKTQRGGMLRGLNPVLHTANLTLNIDYKLTIGPQGGPLPSQQNITMKHIQSQTLSWNKANGSTAI